ncbi:hypothetical protein HNY73_013423 [Argiope bruennichi]|uniref:Uncharacterized protein n=1 Tax=Argiope bruennichi TaxID=94029 RepID=A0A8T0EZQ7_ARGBR|nr:hypothetical protein HNY73_013423 [Argiope bruennichi]
MFPLHCIRLFHCGDGFGSRVTMRLLPPSLWMLSDIGFGEISKLFSAPWGLRALVTTVTTYPKIKSVLVSYKIFGSMKIWVSPTAFGKLCIISDYLQMWTTTLSEILYQCRYLMVILMKLMFGVFITEQHHER